jgi:hypothetical protein
LEDLEEEAAIEGEEDWREQHPVAEISVALCSSAFSFPLDAIVRLDEAVGLRANVSVNGGACGGSKGAL